MNLSFRQAKIAGVLVIAGALVCSTALANSPSTVPFNDSFEIYAAGPTVIGTNGWYAETNTYMTVTNNGDYGYSATTYPLNASNHTQVAVLDTENSSVSNLFNTAGTGSDNVWLDLMLYPTRWTDDEVPDMSGSTDIELSLYLTSNGNAVVYHNTFADFGGPNSTNAHSVTTYTVADSNWVRLTVQSTNLLGAITAFSVRFDGGSPLTHANAFDSGGNPGGEWFVTADLVNPRGIEKVEFSGTGMLDDFVVTDSAPEFSIMWAITASINSVLGGSISPSGTFMVSDGVNTSVTITVSNFWSHTVDIDGGPAGSPLLVTFTNVQANHTVDVTVVEQFATNGTGVSVPKWWLADNVGPTSTNDSDTVANSDADTLTNWEEWLASTDPTDPASTFEITEHYVTDGTGYVVWVSKAIDPSLPPFAVHRSTNINDVSGGWTVVDDSVARGAGPGGTNLWQDASPPPAGTPVYYRVSATN